MKTEKEIRLEIEKHKKALEEYKEQYKSNKISKNIYRYNIIDATSTIYALSWVLDENNGFD